MLREDFRRKNFIVTHRFKHWPDQTGEDLIVADRFFTDEGFDDVEKARDGDAGGPGPGDLGGVGGDADSLVMADDQAHHLINVMRAKSGDEVVLFDRYGNEYDTQIVEVKKKQLTLKRIATRRPERRSNVEITIAAALPKGDRQKFLIEKLVELGVATFIPLTTPRSVAQVNPKVIARIEKQIIEATKQCRRSYLMQVTPAKTLAEVLAIANNGFSARYVAHPYNAIPVASLSSFTTTQSADASCIWLIGPEGGFSDDEVQTAVEAGWQAISFGEIILRVETAAMVAAMASAAVAGKGSLV